MSEPLIGIFCILGSLVAVQAGMHIAVALMLASFVGVSSILSFDVAGRMLANSSVTSISNYVFGVIPLFVLMGLIVSKTSIGRDLFTAAASLMRRVLGGLGMSTVAANAVFAACTGTSIASASVFTRIAVPEMERLGYTTRFSVGVVGGSSILGMLIPPSLLFIVYGVIANQSIGDLFIAGLVPGVLMALAFCLCIAVLCRAVPDFVFTRRAEPETGAELGLPTILKLLTPVAILVGVVLGGIYLGFFTPTEAGGVGAFAALLIGVARRELGLSTLWTIALETGRVTAAIIFLLMAAQIYAQMLTLTGLPAGLNAWLVENQLGFVAFILAYLLLLIVLGTFLDSMSIMLIVLPFALEFVVGFGSDLIWFGVITIVAVEIGLLTPPLGLSCFVIKANMDREDVAMKDIFIGAFPFLLTMVLVLALLTAFPVLSLILV
ncbi:MAG: TRAP transporter large permease [Pseudomonadota bacterium]